jgi:hypothetical protein
MYPTPARAVERPIWWLELRGCLWLRALILFFIVVQIPVAAGPLQRGDRAVDVTNAEATPPRVDLSGVSRTASMAIRGADPGPMIEPGGFSQVDRLEANLALLQVVERRHAANIASLRDEVVASRSWPVSAWVAVGIASIVSGAAVIAALIVQPTASRRRVNATRPVKPVNPAGLHRAATSVAPTTTGQRDKHGRQPDALNDSQRQSLEALTAVLQELELLAILRSWGAGIEALQRYVTSGPPVSPLPFLAFLRLCRPPFGDAHAREVVIAMYQQCFECPQPSPLTLDEEWGLERHPKVRADVVAAWGTGALPHTLFKHLFALPLGVECLAVEAGLELVFLFELDASCRGEALPPDASAPAARSSTATTQVRPAPGGASAAPAGLELGPRLGFDIDLDDLERAVAVTP